MPENPVKYKTAVRKKGQHYLVEMSAMHDKCTTLYSVYVSIKYVYKSARIITEACDLEDNIFLSYKH